MVATPKVTWIIPNILKAARVRRNSVDSVVTALPHQDTANGPLNVLVLEGESSREIRKSPGPQRVVIGVLIGVHWVCVVRIPVAQLRNVARNEDVVTPDSSLLDCETDVDIGLDVTAGSSRSYV